MFKQWLKRAVLPMTAAVLLSFPPLIQAQATVTIQAPAPPARAANQQAFPTLLTLPLMPDALAAVGTTGFGYYPYVPFAYTPYYYGGYSPYYFGYAGSNYMPGLNFSSLAAITGWSAGQSAGLSLTSALTSELFTYTSYIQHGYGTGRPQYYPNARMLAVIAGSPVYPPGAAGSAELKIKAPKEAEIWVNGKPLKWTEKGWLYQSGTISANAVQSLAIRAKWGSANYEVSRAADVVLRPGDRQSVTFISGEPGSP